MLALDYLSLHLILSLLCDQASGWAPRKLLRWGRMPPAKPLAQEPREVGNLLRFPLQHWAPDGQTGRPPVNRWMYLPVKLSPIECTCQGTSGPSNTNNPAHFSFVCGFFFSMYLGDQGSCGLYKAPTTAPSFPWGTILHICRIVSLSPWLRRAHLIGWPELYVHQGILIDNDTMLLPKGRIQVIKANDGGTDTGQAWADTCTTTEREKGGDSQLIPRVCGRPLALHASDRPLHAASWGWRPQPCLTGVGTGAHRVHASVLQSHETKWRPFYSLLLPMETEASYQSVKMWNIKFISSFRNATLENNYPWW